MPIPHAAREEREKLRSEGRKRCSKCREVRDFSEFYNASSTWDRLHPQCKACVDSGMANVSARRRARWSTGDEDPYANPAPKTCPACRVERPRPDFHSNPSSVDGLASECSDCAAVRASESRTNRRLRWKSGEETPYANPLPKRCPGCRTDRPRLDFSTNPGSPDGLKGYCNECAASRQSELHMRRRARWAVEDPYATPSLKRCSRCTLNRPRSDFSTSPSAADGLKGLCKGCNSAAQSTREAKKRNNWVEHVDRAIAWNLAGGICYLCSTPCDANRWDLDHVDPIVNGGEHSYFNTAPTHPECNRSKGGTPWPDVAFDPAS